MAGPIEIGLINLGLVIGLMLLLWVISLIKRDASIIDPVWGTGFALIACASIAMSPHSCIAAAAGAWWSIASPIVMSVLLMKVSGVSLLESDIEDRRPEYREYKRRTNAFFPRPVKK